MVYAPIIMLSMSLNSSEDLFLFVTESYVKSKFWVIQFPFSIQHTACQYIDFQRLLIWLTLVIEIFVAMTYNSLHYLGGIDKFLAFLLMKLEFHKGIRVVDHRK